MKRWLGILAVLCSSSGCYTVLRHPDVEPEGASAYGDGLGYDADYSSGYGLGPGQDCAACHDTWTQDGWDPRPLPWPPVWLAYNTGPWWQRSGTAQAQGGALVNTRPAPLLNPPPPVPIGVPVTIGAPVVKPPPPGLSSEPTARPRPGAAPGDDRVHAPQPGGRDATSATAPHGPPAPPQRNANPAPAPDHGPKPAPPQQAGPPQPASPPAAPPSTSQGSSLPNSRPRPS